MIGLRERVEFLKPGGVDRYGNPLPPTSMGMFPAAVHPLSTEEKALYGGTVTEDRLKVILPPLDLAIASSWQVKFDGKTYDLHGSPETHRVNGRRHHMELVVKRVT